MRLQGRIRHRRQPLHRPLQHAAPQACRILRQPGQIFPRPADKEVLPLPVTPQTGVSPGTWTARAGKAENCGVGAYSFISITFRRNFRVFLYGNSSCGNAFFKIWQAFVSFLIKSSARS